MYLQRYAFFVRRRQDLSGYYYKSSGSARISRPIFASVNNIKYQNDMRKLTIMTAFIVATLSLNAQTTKSMETEKQNSPIAAKVLYDAFAKDKAQAEKKYRNQTMKISGFVTYSGPDPYTLPSIELSEKKGGKSRVLCVLSFSDYLQLRRVSKGNEVVMEGEVRSLYEKGQTIVVKECKIIEVKK